MQCPSSTLYKGIDIADKSERVANFHKNTLKALASFIGACGFQSAEKESKATGVDWRRAGKAALRVSGAFRPSA